MKLSKKFKVRAYVIILNQRGPVLCSRLGKRPYVMLKCNIITVSLTGSWNWWSDYFSVDISEKHLTSGLENQTVDHRDFD